VLVVGKGQVSLLHVYFGRGPHAKLAVNKYTFYPGVKRTEAEIPMPAALGQQRAEKSGRG